MDSDTVIQISRLTSEWASINRAVELFDMGARITNLMLATVPSPGVPGQLPQAGSVSTEYMNYPPQMVDTIKSLLATRKGEIEGELANLGVTLEGR